MAEDKYLQFGSGNKFSLNNMKSNISKNDFANNNKLQKLFNLFDTDGNGIIDVKNINGENEVQNLWNSVQRYSLKNGNSIFDNEEVQSLINESQINANSTDAEKITISDVFQFLKNITNKKEDDAVRKGTDALSQSYTPEEIEDLSIQTVTDDVLRARQIFEAQNKNQGVVSDFVNGTKETFDTEFAASRVNRYLMREALCADLLAQSKSEDGLSEKEYLEAKINLAVSMLPKLEESSLKSSIVKNILSLGLYKGFGNKTKAEQERIAQEMEIELLKDALRKLKPEELTSFIQTVTAMPDDEYNEKAAKAVENMINMSLQEKIRDNQKPMADSNQVFFKHIPIPGSIEDIEQHNDIYRKMSFEETFEEERGVQYNSENIMDYTEKDAKMQFLLGMHNKRQQIYNILHDATVTVDGNNKFGAPDTRAIKPCENQLESAILRALTNLYGNEPEKLQAGLDKLGFSNLKIIDNKLIFDYGDGNSQNSAFNVKHECNGYELVEIANKLQGMVDANYQSALGDKTIEEYGQEVSLAYQKAYGTNNAQNMAEAFAQSQQEGVQTVKTVVQTGAMVVMVAGQLVPVGGQVASAMIMGGLVTSTVGGVGISALENYTKEGGPTEEDKKEMLKELGVSIALVSSGMGIGKTSEAAFRALVLKNCPKLLAFAGEVGIDATMSLVADYAITGQIDLSGEGIAQLQAILVGVLHAKGNFKTYLNTHAGDLTAKPRVDESTSTVGRTAQKPVSDTPTIKGNDNDIPRLSQEEINRMKASDSSIRQMPDGTIIKTDNTGKSSVIGRLYDKAVHTTRKIIAEFSPTEKLLNSSSREAHLKLLLSLNDTNGKPKFTETDINKILDNLPKKINVTGRNIYALMALPDITVDNALSILSKIDSPEKLQVLNALTDTSDRIWNLTHKTSYIPDNELNSFEIENILENLKDNGKLYVNENGTATEIKLSKEKFEELFPPLTRVSFEQGALGDCWFVTTLDNFMDLPNGRTSLYKLFEQQGDDILIKFPNGSNPIRFEGGKVLDANGKQIRGLSQEEIPTGIRMIEQAYAVHRYRKYDYDAPVTDIAAHATNVESLMKELKGGWQYDAVNEILGDYNASVDSYGVNLSNRNKMKEYIQQYANDENVLTFFATRHIPGGDSHMIAEKYDLAGGHAYSIKGYDETTGMVYITNPWHTSVITEVPLYELMKYIDDVNFAHFNKKEV